MLLLIPQNLHGSSLTNDIYTVTPIKDTTLPSSSPSDWQIDKAFSKSSLNKLEFFKNSLYVAIGMQGTIRTSSDGQNWTINTDVFLNCQSDLLDIACTDESIVIVGSKGTILHSTDGLYWTSIQPITNYDIYKVIHGKDLFIGFTQKAGEYLISKDGLEWKVISTDAKEIVNDAVWNGQVYITVGANGEICTSENGLNWKAKNIKNKPYLSKIVWNGKIFITFGTTSVEKDYYSYTSGTYVATSNDGYSWNTKSLITKYSKKDSKQIYIINCENIIWNGKEFLIFLNETSGMGPSPENKMIIYRTTDGKSFKMSSNEIGSPPSFLVYTGKYYLMLCNNFALPGYYYGPSIYKSSDGLKWNLVKNEYIDDYCVKNLIFNYGQFLLVGDSGLIQTSRDGVNWEDTKNLRYIPQFWDGEKFIYIDFQGYVYTSANGFDWKKEHKIKDGISRYNLTWTGKEFISNSDSSFSTSKDLINWEVTKFDDDSPVYKDVGYICAISTDQNKYIIAGTNGTAISADRKNWRTKKAPNAYKEIVFGNDSYIAFNSYGDIDYSDDGLTWKRVHIKDYTNKFLKVAFVDNQYQVIGSDGTIFVSPNGKNWTKYTDGLNVKLSNVLLIGHQIVAHNNFCVYTLNHNNVWQKENIPINYKFNISVYGSKNRLFVYNGLLYFKDLNQ